MYNNQLTLPNKYDIILYLLLSLVANNIIGENSLVKSELDAQSTELRSGLGDRNNRGQKNENLIYGTLAKYIIQMLISNTGKVLYPEIIPLNNHKSTYFTERK